MHGILVIESGATNTRIGIGKEGGKWTLLETFGLNGNINSSDDYQELFRWLKNEIDSVVHELHFYGAGVSAESGRLKVVNAIKDHFSDSQYFINSDVLGACRSTLAHNPGNLAILGTGAIFVSYNGTEITHTKSGLGIILGDEGSGAHAGKMLISAYLNGLLNNDTIRLFELKYALTREEIYRQVYHSSKISKWLGQFSYFLADHMEKEDIREIVENNFRSFFDIISPGLDRTSGLCAIGGFVSAFKETFCLVADTYGIRISEINQNIFNGLLAYHEN